MLQQNGVVERKNRHIAEVAIALMTKKNMPHFYWAKIANIVAYIMNRSPTIALHVVTPKEQQTCQKLDLSHMKVFGCNACACTR